jgi:hypothetical protein
MTIDDETKENDQHLLDLLVDGELDDVRRRELLTRLDAEPEGWRRCALAFLEHRAWQDTLGSGANLGRRGMPAGQPMILGAGHMAGTNGLRVASRSVEPASISRVPCDFVPAIPAHQVHLRRSMSLPRFSAVLTGLAACVVLAFGLGWATRGMSGLPTTPLRNSAQIATHGARPTVRRLPHVPVAPPDERAHVASNAQPRAIPAVADSEQSLAAAAKPVAISDASATTDWFHEAPTPLPQEVQRHFERRGYEVQQQRRLVSVRLRNGREVRLPVEEIKFNYIGNRTY